MATTTYLSNPAVSIGATDVSDQCTAATLTIGYDSLETTAFGDTGHKFTKGLQTVEVTLTLFASYDTSEMEATLAAIVGNGTTSLKIAPANLTTPAATNPIYEISNAMLSDFTPINATVGELSQFEVTFTGGTWVRDITP
jgi:hypothetical protein